MKPFSLKNNCIIDYWQYRYFTKYVTSRIKFFKLKGKNFRKNQVGNLRISTGPIVSCTSTMFWSIHVLRVVQIGVRRRSDCIYYLRNNVISELFFEGVVNMILLFGLSNTLCLAKVLLNFSGVSQSCFLRDYVHLAVYKLSHGLNFCKTSKRSVSKS